MEFLRFLPRERLKRIIFAALTVMWCGMIFYLSSQNGDQSSETSAGFISTFCEMIVPKFSGFDGTQRAELVESLQFIVRKLAHFTAYFILSVFAMQFFKTFKRLKRTLYCGASSVLFCMLYAASDELHQLFVSGRSAQLRDVLIDTGGALLSAIFQGTIIYLLNRRQKKQGR